MFDPAVVDVTVDFLAGSGRGRGRPRAGHRHRPHCVAARARGVPVHGIDLSPDMVARLQEKPGASAIGVTIGDFATTVGAGYFPLGLPRLQHHREPHEPGRAGGVLRQRRPTPGAGEYLRHRGRGAAAAPAASGETTLAFDVTPDRVGFDDVRCGRTTRRVPPLLGRRRTGRDVSLPYRYVWPAELDLMARIGGMRLRERWSGWRRVPFTGDSASHVSVWEKTSDQGELTDDKVRRLAEGRASPEGQGPLVGMGDDAFEALAAASVRSAASSVATPPRR